MNENKEAKWMAMLEEQWQARKEILAVIQPDILATVNAIQIHCNFCDELYTLSHDFSSSHRCR